jgi:AraC-like DNA-binding protein
VAGRAARPFFEGEQPPPSRFAEHVLALWSLDVELPEGQTALHTVWPDGCASVAVVASGGAPLAATVVGPRLRPVRLPVRAGFAIRGLRLWPDSAAQVLGIAPAAIRGLTRPAAELLGVQALSLARAVARAESDAALDDVWQRWLASRTGELSPPEPSVRLAVRVLLDSDGLRDLADAAAGAHVSRSTLDRRFRAAVGLTTSQFARVRRVRAAIADIADGARSVARLATRFHYEEPARFVREFRSIAGVSPESMMAQLDQLEHGDAPPRVSAS